MRVRYPSSLLIRTSRTPGLEGNGGMDPYKAVGKTLNPKLFLNYSATWLELPWASKQGASLSGRLTANILGLYREQAKENGNYYSKLGFY